AVDGIKVGRSFERLHVLHSASGKEDDGIPVASLVLHYADGGQAAVPIRYGETVRDWWFWEFEGVRDPATAMAWTGNNPSARAEEEQLLRNACLAHTGLANPVAGMAERRATIPPLPSGEGRGEGKEDVAHPTVS